MMPELFATIPCPGPMPGLFWVYILQSADHALYIGQTNNVPERLRKHGLGLGSKHTHDHAGPRLVYCEGPVTVGVAVQRDRQLKRWSRKKKGALIRGDLSQLKHLSQSRD
jgi:predicted GIY-YIG superfamily endonuclease